VSLGLVVLTDIAFPLKEVAYLSKRLKHSILLANKRGIDNLKENKGESS